MIEEDLKRLKTYVCLFLVTTIFLILFFVGLAFAGVELSASWYNDASLIKEGTWKNGKQRMANGEVFNENAFTCATRLYPLGSVLRIISIDSGRSVVVRVTDRIGKRFAKTRIDLTARAFQELADLRKGVISIRVEVLK